jgi:DNA-binding NarL/FixJ family response regulator
MIRVAVVDDHPALRAGLHTVIDAEPGLLFVGESNGTDETLWPMLQRVKPDVVLLDYHLPHGDGFQLCHHIKQKPPPPKVLVYSAYASPALAVPAALAKADGLLDKGAAARELFDAIRRVQRGERVLPAPSRAHLQDAYETVTPDDRPVMALLLDHASYAEIAETLRVDVRDVHHTVQRIIGQLRLHVPSARSL